MPNILPSAAAPRNRLLDRLPGPTRQKLLPLLKPIQLAFEQVIYEMDGPIDYAYFPAGGVLSALSVMRDGNAIEVATVGCEGMVGYYGFGGKTSPHKVIAQVSGFGYRVAAPALEALAEEDDSLKVMLSAYPIAFMAQVSQSVACNGLHRLEQRCCRWLLMTRDRVASDEIRLTHEYLAIMLGARRASVTDVLQPLQDAGLVRSHRGVITILDGAGLEARSCECYLVVRERYAEVFGDIREDLRA